MSRLSFVTLLLISGFWACKPGSDLARQLSVLQNEGSNSSQTETATAAGGCSLSPADQRKAVQSFKALMPVFHHPRCANCHGGINFFSPTYEALHGGGAVAMVDRDVEGPDGSIIARQRPDFETCGECHDAATDWRIPAPVQDISFAGRTAGQICEQIKRASGAPQNLLNHLQKNEDIRLGFEGRRGHTSLSPEPPPLTAAAFKAKVGVWLQAMKATESWPDPSSCGCIPPGKAGYSLVILHRVTSEKLGVERSVTMNAVVRELDAPDAEGNTFAGEGSYQGSARRYNPSCDNNMRTDYETIPLGGNAKGAATADDLGGGQISLVFSITPLDPREDLPERVLPSLANMVLAGDSGQHTQTFEMQGDLCRGSLTHVTEWSAKRIK